MSSESIFYEYDPNGIDEVIEDTSASSFIAMREVRWNENSDFKLDIRRYFNKQDGTEMPGKGISINNPDRLTETLIKSGFGIMDNLIRIAADNRRTEFVSSVGRYCATMDTDEYQEFIDDIGAERDKAILDRGMSAEEFIGKL